MADVCGCIQGSGKKIEYNCEETKRKYVPHVIEPSIGVDRSAYISIRQHTSAYVSIRQHTSAYAIEHSIGVDMSKLKA